MKSNRKKILIMFAIFSIISFLFISQVKATTFNPNNYTPSSMTNVSGASKLEEVGNRIIGLVQVIGSISSVVALIIIGIKYIMGSVEEKAEYKQTLKPYVIGAVFVFGITNILAIIQSVIAGF